MKEDSKTIDELCVNFNDEEVDISTKKNSDLSDRWIVAEPYTLAVYGFLAASVTGVLFTAMHRYDSLLLALSGWVTASILTLLIATYWINYYALKMSQSDFKVAFLNTEENKSWPKELVGFNDFSIWQNRYKITENNLMIACADYEADKNDKSFQMITQLTSTLKILEDDKEKFQLHQSINENEIRFSNLTKKEKLEARLLNTFFI
ncbi:MAG: hypothetical protein EOP04_03535 [Proteobacteria bacterium]|nr:MAG: hypothetical protein EOP04_03535 [Pseudomonadota bacterium]